MQAPYLMAFNHVIALPPFLTPTLLHSGTESVIRMTQGSCPWDPINEIWFGEFASCAGMYKNVQEDERESLN